MTSSKSTANWVGILFLVAMLSYATGFGIIQSILEAPNYLVVVIENKPRFIFCILLMLVNSGAVVGIGVFMHSFLKQYNGKIAIGYLCARVIESIVLIVGVVGLLSLTLLSERVPNAGVSEQFTLQTLGSLAIKTNYFAYQIAMFTLGTGSLGLCYSLFKTLVLPKFLSAWGFIGYAALATGAVLELFGFPVGLTLSIPGGLFEIFLPFWLFTKGFHISN